MEAGLDSLHASHSQNGDKHNLRPEWHIQIFNKKERKKSEREVRNDRTAAVEKGEGDDDVDVDAEAVLGRISREPRPEEADRGALQERDEEEDKASQDRYPHRTVDDPFVYGLDRYPEEEQTNGSLGEDHGKSVGDVAKPPVLCNTSASFP